MFDPLKRKNLKEFEGKYQLVKQEFEDTFTMLDNNFSTLVLEAGKVDTYLNLHYLSLKEIKFIWMAGIIEKNVLYMLYKKMNSELANMHDYHSSRISIDHTESATSKLGLKTKAAIGTTVVAGSAIMAPVATTTAVSMLFSADTTGTSIASLSGAAATNATLAWLGGGALSIGGGGMAAGQAVLAMMGPIGAAMGLAVFFGGNIFFERRKNSKQIERLVSETAILVEGTEAINLLMMKIEILRENYLKDLQYLKDKYNIILNYKKNFLFLTDNQQNILRLHIMNLEVIAARVYAKIDMENSTFRPTIQTSADKVFQPLSESINWESWNEVPNPTPETIILHKSIMCGIGVILIVICAIFLL